MKTQDIGEILKGLNLEKHTPGIVRAQLRYDMGTAMKVVEGIGKARSARFQIDDQNRFLYENLIRWVMGDPEMKAVNPDNWREVIPGDVTKGVFIGGRTGTGKSWAMEIMSLFTRVDGVGMKAGGNSFFLEWPNVRTSALVNEYSLTGRISEYSKRPVICFQDLGAEQAEAMFMGNRCNVMKTILEERGDNKNCLTLITSNLPIVGADMEKMYGQRVTSRLREMCNYIVVGGEDRRK